MVNIICALKHEARPLIAHFQMLHDGEQGAYATYRNEDISLTVTGPGRRAAAAGTRYAGTHFRDVHDGVWLNLGIAGHRDLPLGTPVLAGRITDAADNRVWLPGNRLQTHLNILPLITVDQPMTDYRQNCMYDMEAAGFYRSANQFTVTDRIYCLKFISDNAASRIEQISKQSILDLIGMNIPVIRELLLQLRTLPAGTTTI